MVRYCYTTLYFATAKPFIDLSERRNSGTERVPEFQSDNSNGELNSEHFRETITSILIARRRGAAGREAFQTASQATDPITVKIIRAISQHWIDSLVRSTSQQWQRGGEQKEPPFNVQSKR